jgi:hypothetical protein
METAPNFTEFVLAVVTSARDFTPRETVELGIIHGLCVDAAADHAPYLIEFLGTVQGLDALSGALSQMPDVLMPADIAGSSWFFVRGDGDM